MTWYVSSTKRHRRGDRQRGDEGARPQLDIDRVAVGRRVDGRLVEVPLRVRELRAAGVDLRLRGRELRPRCRDRACSPLTCLTASARPAPRSPSRVAICASSSITLASACSSANLSPAPVATNSRFCRTRSSRQVELRLQRADLSRWRTCSCSCNCRAPGRRIHQACAGLSRASPRRRRACALATLRSFWYGVGSMRNSNSPFLTSRLGSTGTSITRPRTCGITCTTYLMTRTSARRRRDHVERQDQRRQRDDRDDDDGDLRRRCSTAAT